MRGVVIKLIAAIALTTLGIYFFAGTDTKVAAQTEPPTYKVEWQAKEFLVLDFDKLFYPRGHGANYNPDPADHGAKTKLAIGVHRWDVIYSVKSPTCTEEPCTYTTKYEETWLTGADPSIPGHEKFTAAPNNNPDNCYKVPANCKPGGRYAGEWSWSFGSEFTDQANFQFANQTFREVTNVAITSVSDTNLYVNNSDIYTSLYPTCDMAPYGAVSCWWGPKGRGPGFLEVYQCNTNELGSFPTCKIQYGFGAPLNLYIGTNFHTSGPYAWQHTGQQVMNTSELLAGSDASGTLAPTKWFVTGRLYD